MFRFQENDINILNGNLLYRYINISLSKEKLFMLCDGIKKYMRRARGESF